MQPGGPDATQFRSQFLKNGFCRNSFLLNSLVLQGNTSIEMLALPALAVLQSRQLLK